MKQKTALELAVSEIECAIVRSQQEELRYRFNGAYQEAESEKEKRVELERVKKDVEALYTTEQNIMVDFGAECRLRANLEKSPRTILREQFDNIK